MPLKASGNVFTSKTSSTTFKDGNKRTQKGRFGQDKSNRFLSANSPFLTQAFELPLGKYKFSFDVEMGASDFRLSAGVGSADNHYKPVNKKLSEFINDPDFSEGLLAPLKSSMARLKCPLDAVIVKGITMEGPGARVGVGLGRSAVGGRAHAQLAAVSVTLETPLGEIEAKLKHGLGVGASYGNVYSKKGKPGTYKETTVTLGMWEMSIKPNEAPILSSPTDTKKERIPEAQRKAEAFVQTQTERSESRQSSSGSGEKKYDPSQMALLDETAKQLADALKADDPGVEELYEKYKTSEDKPREFVKYEEDLIKRAARSEFQINQLMDAGVNTSLFLSQVARLTHNKGLGRFASGLGASIQIFSGFKSFTSAASLLGTASFGVTAFSSLMEGAGLVLGGLSVISSLFGDDEEEDNGLAEALTAIYSAIKAMHTEMRESFQQTWDMLETMERNNAERFERIMGAIEYSYDNISSQLAASDSKTNNHISDLQDYLKSILDHIVDAHVKAIIKNISKTPPNELLEYVTFRDYTTNLENWLIGAAALTARTGALERAHQELTIDQEGLIRRLEEASAPERSESLDIKVGLFVSLVQDLGLNIFPTSLNIINPQDWFIALNAYQYLILIGKEVIFGLPEAQQKPYVDSIKAMKKIVVDMKEVFSKMAASRLLWGKLVTNYQDKFDELKNKIDQKNSEINKPELPNEIRISLFETGSQNMYRLGGLPNNAALANQLTSADGWIGVEGKRREDLCGDTSHNSKNKEELGFVLDNARFDVMSARTPAVKEGINQIQSSIKYALARHYSLAAPSVAYCIQPGNIHGIPYHTLHVLPSVKINDIDYPFAQGNFFQKEKDAIKSEIGSTSLYTRESFFPLIGFFTPSFDIKVNSNYRSRTDFYEGLNLVPDLFEDKILIPARKEIVNNLNRDKEIKQFSDTTLNQFVLNLKAAYLELVSFIQFIDPTFPIKKDPQVITRIKNEISILAANPTAEALANLYKTLLGAPRSSHRASGAVWQEELWEYIGNNLASFSVDDLRARLSERLLERPLWKALELAEKAIEETEELIDPERNKAFLLETLKKDGSEIQSQQKVLEKAITVLDNSVGALRVLGNKDTTLSIFENDIISLKELNKVFVQELQQLNDLELITLVTEHDFKKEEARAHSEKKIETPQLDFDSTLYKGDGKKLRELCSNPNSSHEAVTEVINRLENTGYSELKAVLNGGVVIERPLGLAIGLGRSDIVALLLEHDAMIEEEMLEIFDALPEGEEKNAIEALIQFYSHMQKQTLEEHIGVGKTLALISESMDVLSEFKGLEGAVVYIGETRVGKSTLINHIMGIDYEPKRFERGQKYLKPNKKEYAKVSNDIGSETTYPEIFPLDESFLVDLPGFEDSRGEPWDIALGISTEMLSSSFKSMKALVLVCDGHDFFNANIDSVFRSFKMLGKIVNQQPELMENVVLILNKADADDAQEGSSLVLEQLKYFGRQEKREFSPEAKYVLKNIKPENIFIIKHPSSEFRTEFMDRMNKIGSKPFKSFNFSSFHPDVQKFKTLFERLKTYREEVAQNLHGRRHWFFEKTGELLEKTEKTILDTELSTQFLRVLPQDLQQLQEVVENAYVSATELREDALALLNSLRKYMNEQYQDERLPFSILEADLLSEINKYQSLLSVIDGFYKKVQPIAVHLGIQLEDKVKPVLETRASENCFWVEDCLEGYDDDECHVPSEPGVYQVKPTSTCSGYIVTGAAASEIIFYPSVPQFSSSAASISEPFWHSAWLALHAALPSVYYSQPAVEAEQVFSLPGQENRKYADAFTESYSHPTYPMMVNEDSAAHMALWGVIYQNVKQLYHWTVGRKPVSSHRRGDRAPLPFERSDSHVISPPVSSDFLTVRTEQPISPLFPNISLNASLSGPR